MVLFRRLLVTIAAFGALAMSPSVVLTESADLDPRAEKLLRELEARRSLPLSHDRWKAENGPWAAYLDKPFEDGLSPRERTLFDEAQREGNCQLVRSLRSAGFLLLYPFLAPVHVKPYVHDYFYRKILYQSHDSVACDVRSELLHAVDLARRKRLDVLPFDAGAAAKGRRPKIEAPTDSLEVRVRNTICRTLSFTKTLAFDHRHKQAVLDLLRYRTEPRIVMLNSEQEYLLFKIAASLGIDDSWIRKMGATSDLRMSMKSMFEIERYVRGNNEGNMPSGIFWHCQKPVLEPFLAPNELQRGVE